MRLIDADKLEIQMFGLNGDGVSEYNIENAQTVNAIVIPDGATNGDMIRAVLPYLEIANEELCNDNLCFIYAYYGGVGTCFERTSIVFERDWWNAPYKKVR